MERKTILIIFSLMFVAIAVFAIIGMSNNNFSLTQTFNIEKVYEFDYPTEFTPIYGTNKLFEEGGGFPINIRYFSLVNSSRTCDTPEGIDFTFYKKGVFSALNTQRVFFRNKPEIKYVDGKLYVNNNLFTDEYAWSQTAINDNRYLTTPTLYKNEEISVDISDEFVVIRRGELFEDIFNEGYNYIIIQARVVCWVDMNYPNYETNSEVKYILLELITPYCGDGICNTDELLAIPIGESWKVQPNTVLEYKLENNISCPQDCKIEICEDYCDGNDLYLNIASNPCEYKLIPNACATCGNGEIDIGEECDDGNLIDDDECNNRCFINKTPFPWWIIVLILLLILLLIIIIYIYIKNKR